MSSAAQATRTPLLWRWADLVLEGLGDAREEIDALNVYPVPDGDTGTNLYLTFEAARNALYDVPSEDDVTACRVLSRGALLGARGNSGVILAQLLRAATESLAASADGSSALRAGSLARAFASAANAGYEAVGDPVEGTILTVARAAGDAATEVASAGGDVPATIRAATGAAREALARTQDQLDVLRAAGVVDAGGRGLVVILEATETALTGRRPVRPAHAMGRHTIPMPIPAGSDLSPGGPGYEVMYLLDADDGGIPALRATLAPLGDSLVVVGGDGLWNVHVHVDDVGAAIEAGIAAGRPYRIRVTHFADQAGRRPERPARAYGRGVVVVAAGPGLEEVFAAAGATVVPGGPGRACSTAELLEAIRRTATTEVVVLPNGRDTISAAEAAAQAARDESIRVAVIPTRAQVQGLAALAVHEPGRGFDEDVVHMTSAAGHARNGAVTIAARDAMTMAGPCAVGDALGVVEGDFVLVGKDLRVVAVDVVERMLRGSGGEMVTLVTGADADPQLAGSVVRHLRQTRPEVDVVVYDGGQERYPLLMAVE
ncbi:MAG: DAK2 domain-containing protein [Propionibacteriales bacterium]|nr:DAK2 domain-containing protein [Propionibacteriales bacterium]